MELVPFLMCFLRLTTEATHSSSMYLKKTIKGGIDGGKTEHR
jgi:hypothetical protein